MLEEQPVKDIVTNLAPSFLSAFTLMALPLEAQLRIRIGVSGVVVCSAWLLQDKIKSYPWILVLLIGGGALYLWLVPKWLTKTRQNKITLFNRHANIEEELKNGSRLKSTGLGTHWLNPGIHNRLSDHIQDVRIALTFNQKEIMKTPDTPAAWTCTSIKDNLVTWECVLARTIPHHHTEYSPSNIGLLFANGPYRIDCAIRGVGFHEIKRHFFIEHAKD